MYSRSTRTIRTVRVNCCEGLFADPRGAPGIITAKRQPCASVWLRHIPNSRIKSPLGVAVATEVVLGEDERILGGAAAMAGW